MRVLVDEPQNGPVHLEIFVNLRWNHFTRQIVQVFYQHEGIGFSHRPERFEPGDLSEIGDDLAVLEPGNEFCGEAVHCAKEVQSHFFD